MLERSEPLLVARERLPRRWSLFWRIGWLCLPIPLHAIGEELGLRTGQCYYGCFAPGVWCESLWPFVPMLIVPLVPAILVVLRRIRRFSSQTKRESLGVRCGSRTEPIHETASGTVVSVRGRVCEARSFTSLGGRPNVVLVSYVISSPGRLSPHHTVAPLREVRGVDFGLLLDTDEKLSVRVAPPLHLALPTPEAGDLMHARPLLTCHGVGGRKDGDLVHDEATIVCGDRVEVTGTILREVNASEESGYRGDRLTIKIAGSERMPLVVRLLAADTPEPNKEEVEPEALPDKSLQADDRLGRFAPSVARR
jgi:hypothetical protein